MGSLIPRPFRNRPKLWELAQDKPSLLYISTTLIMYDKKSNLPNKAWGDLTMMVPKVDQEAAMTCNNYLKDVTNRIQDGQGLFISGGVGTGKTTWAYKIAIEYLQKTSHHGIDPNRIPVYFVNVPSLLNDLKLAFNDPKKMENINHRLQSADLVIFDDIGAESDTKWAMETLYQYINYRYANGKSSIFTSNLPITQLEMRVADRIKEVNEIATFKGQSRRERKQ